MERRLSPPRGGTPSSASQEQDEWNGKDLVTYNFESPWMPRRVEKLRTLFADIAKTRTIAILSHNRAGVIGLINLLNLAGLAKYFSAIWIISGGATPGPLRDGAHRGAYQVGGRWICFEPHFRLVNDHKADVLHHVMQHPQLWFPQLAEPTGPLKKLLHMKPESIALVDDERQNFRSWGKDTCAVMRYCKVARYDEEYRDCGLLNQMGGLGAHSDADFQTLRTFLDAPWEFPYEDHSHEFVDSQGDAPMMAVQASPYEMKRSVGGEDPRSRSGDSSPRSRSKDRAS